MQNDNIKKEYYCYHCGGTGIDPDSDTDSSEIRHCPNCGASIRYKGVEIKVEGKDSNEVKAVTEQLFKQATEIDDSINKPLSLKTKLMGLFSKRVKCKRFYETQSRTIDITGLKTGVPQKFDFGLGTFKLDTKYQEASEQLKTLDLLQYGLCSDINAVSDPTQKDKLLQKIIETKTRMLEIVLELSGNIGKATTDLPHFNYLSKADLINLLLNFNSAAFTTPFRLEESLINYQNRILSVSELISDKLKDVHPDYKRYVIEIFTLLKALRKLSQKFNDRTYFIPWQYESLAIDVLRYAIINKVNSLLSALQAPDRINNERFLKDSYIVSESKNYPDIDRTEQIKTEAEEVKAFCLAESIEAQVVDNYFDDLNKLLPPPKS